MKPFTLWTKGIVIVRGRIRMGYPAYSIYIPDHKEWHGDLHVIEVHQPKNMRALILFNTKPYFPV